MEDSRGYVMPVGPSQRVGQHALPAGGARAFALHPPFVIAASYVLLTAVTMPFFMGDTIGYAEAIAGRRFTDFGHYGWYWLGYVCTTWLMPISRTVVGPALEVNIAFWLIVLSWLTGLMSVLLMRSLVFRVTGQQRPAYVATSSLMVSQAFLNFTQSGCSYTFGMSFLLLGIWTLVTRDDWGPPSWRSALLAGSAMFVAVAVWFTFVFSIPAALLAPSAVHGFSVRRLMTAIQTGIVMSILLLVTFGAGGYANGVRSVEDARQWVADASHGVIGMNGAPRTMLGFGRSFIDTGNLGPMAKAYMAHDPYNRVSAGDIVRGSLWKLALFYAFAAAIVVNLVRSRDGRRVLALLALNAVPVLGFAIFWQGGAIERYLLLYPLFFLALGYSLASRSSITALRYACIGFVVLMAAVNLGVMATPVQAARQQAVVDRLKPLEPLWKNGSLVVAVTQLDEVWAFRWTFPFHPLNTERALRVHHLIEPGTRQDLTWRAVFVKQALATWARGGDVWVSNRVRSERPQPEWKWVEDEAAEVSWTDVTAFFAPFDLGPLIGGQDGFLRFLPSEHNRARLNDVSAHSAY